MHCLPSNFYIIVVVAVDVLVLTGGCGCGGADKRCTASVELGLISGGLNCPCAGHNGRTSYRRCRLTTSIRLDGLVWQVELRTWIVKPPQYNDKQSRHSWRRARQFRRQAGRSPEAEACRWRICPSSQCILVVSSWGGRHWYCRQSSHSCRKGRGRAYCMLSWWLWWWALHRQRRTRADFGGQLSLRRTQWSHHLSEM